MISVRLNEAYDSTMGGIEVSYEGQWLGVCDDGFDDVAAAVTCQSLKMGYIDGKVVHGSAFGNLSGNSTTMMKNVDCSQLTGDSRTLFDCAYQWGKCPSTYYASVQCSNVTIGKPGMTSFQSVWSPCH